MTGTTSWTPAPRGGLIPLQPLGFGTILGRSFAALRGNPKVLLGFAMTVQLVSSLIGAVIIAAVSVWAFSRLDTVSDQADWDAIFAGSMLIVGATTLVVGLALGVLGVIVQGVVIGEVAHAALGERATLGTIWQRVRPAFWRLFGYSLLTIFAVTIAIVVTVAVIVGIGVAGGDSATPVVVLLVIAAILAWIVLSIWIVTKLYVAPSAIVLERAGVFRAIGRSWTLTRGRFWPTFGIAVLISLIMGFAASVIGMPFQLLASLLGATIAPTGDDAGGIVAAIVTVVLSQIVTFLVQTIAIVVQGTSAVLVYLDLRMRKEGIDLRMQRYVEQRDAGRWPLEDPYTYDPNATPPPRPELQYGAAAGYPAYGAGAYPPGPYSVPAAGVPQPDPGYPQPGNGYPQPGPGYPPPYTGAPQPDYGAPQPPTYGAPQPGVAPAPGAPQPFAPPAGAAPGIPPYAPPAEPPVYPSSAPPGAGAGGPAPS